MYILLNFGNFYIYCKYVDSTYNIIIIANIVKFPRPSFHIVEFLETNYRLLNNLQQKSTGAGKKEVCNSARSSLAILRGKCWEHENVFLASTWLSVYYIYTSSKIQILNRKLHHRRRKTGEWACSVNRPVQRNITHLRKRLYYLDGVQDSWLASFKPVVSINEFLVNLLLSFWAVITFAHVRGRIIIILQVVTW